MLPNSAFSPLTIFGAEICLWLADETGEGVVDVTDVALTRPLSCHGHCLADLEVSVRNELAPRRCFGDGCDRQSVTGRTYGVTLTAPWGKVDGGEALCPKISKGGRYILVVRWQEKGCWRRLQFFYVAGASESIGVDGGTIGTQAGLMSDSLGLVAGWCEDDSGDGDPPPMEPEILGRVYVNKAGHLLPGGTYDFASGAYTPDLLPEADLLAAAASTGNVTYEGASEIPGGTPCTLEFWKLCHRHASIAADGSAAAFPQQSPTGGPTGQCVWSIGGLTFDEHGSYGI